MRKMSKIPEFKKKKIKVKTKIEYQLKRSKNCFFFFWQKNGRTNWVETKRAGLYL